MWVLLWWVPMFQPGGSGGGSGGNSNEVTDILAILKHRAFRRKEPR